MNKTQECCSSCNHAFSFHGMGRTNCKVTGCQCPTWASSDLERVCYAAMLWVDSHGEQKGNEALARRVKEAVTRLMPAEWWEQHLAGGRDQEEDIHALVGYERRLHKMRYTELLAEARRVGAQIFPDITRPILIGRILEVQGINDDILKDPPR